MYVYEFFKGWMMFSFSLGIWTCISILINKSSDNRIKFLLLIFVFLVTIPAIIFCIGLIRKDLIEPLIMTSKSITWLYGPLLLFLINCILLKPVSNLSITLQTVPFFLAIILYTVNIARMPLLLIWLLHVFGYFIFTTSLIIKNKEKILSVYNHHKNTTYYWLLFLVTGLLFAIVVDIAMVLMMVINMYPAPILLGIIGGTLGVYVSCITLFSLHQPDIFHHRATHNDQVIKELDHKEIMSEPVNRPSELSKQAVDELNQSLQCLVEKEKPHLDSSISLSKLSAQLGVSNNLLSELLNLHNGTSFYDFLNQLRLQEALTLLDDHSCELTIADIAYQSGFNNRNTFYSFFRKNAGITPAQYRKNKRKKISEV